MSAGERLENDLHGFFALRQQTDDALFRQRLTQLQQFQSERLRVTHADLLATSPSREALEFLLSDIYGGADLSPVARDIERALPLALKLLPDKVMATAACALEAMLVTQQLDEALTELLAARLDEPLDEAAYIDGYRRLSQQPRRQRQLDLLLELGKQLEKYLRSRLLLGTFRMVNKPAHKAGFGHLYDFMARCFAVMKPLPDAAALLAELSARERAIMQKLFAGDSQPFANHGQAR